MGQASGGVAGVDALSAVCHVNHGDRDKSFGHIGLSNHPESLVSALR